MDAVISAAMFAAGLASMQPAPEEERPLESWTCTVGEQPDEHVSAMLQMLVLPDGTKQALSYYVSWAEQPGHMAMQQMRWVWIPLDATLLWKPDDVHVSVAGERSDEDGGVVFSSPSRAPIQASVRGQVRSLRPHFEITALNVVDAYLVARLWEGWPWRVTLSDRTGVTIGAQQILLPGPQVTQAMFTRLRTRLESATADPAQGCRANLGPTQQELQESQVHWGARIPSPGIEGPAPIGDDDSDN